MEETSFSAPRERTVGSAKRKREENGADGNNSRMEIQVGITTHQSGRLVILSRPIACELIELLKCDERGSGAAARRRDHKIDIPGI